MLVRNTHRESNRMSDTINPCFIRLARAAYQLSASDARLRGRATRIPGALSMSHARILRLLDERGPLFVSELSEGAETSPGAVTQLLKGLVASGYVEKFSRSDDRRKVQVKLTVDGKRCSKEREDKIYSWMQTSLAGFSEKELVEVSSILLRLSELYDTL